MTGAQCPRSGAKVELLEAEPARGDHPCSWLPDAFRWIDIDGPVTRGWWALERPGERLALLQPFRGRVSIVFYLGAQPWSQKHGDAGTISQAKRFAERWLASRVDQEIPTRTVDIG